MAPWDGLPVDVSRPIRALRVHEVRIPLDPPLRLAGRRIPDRTYLVVEVELDRGVTGTAYALTRGQPLGDAALEIVPALVGSPMASTFAPEAGDRTPVGRVRALLDACGWDLLGALAARPVWSLLEERTGRSASRRPALAVAGYRRDGESDATMASRLLECAAEFPHIKLAPGNAEGTDLHGVLGRLAEARDARVVLDFGGAFDTVEHALDAVGSLPPVEFEWVEDAFPPPAAGRTAALRAEFRGPVGAGDEQSAVELGELITEGAVDVLRVDYTTVGGITGALAVLARAEVRSSFHVYPEVHRHLASVFSREVELFPTGDPFDFSDRLFESGVAVGQGAVGLPTEPGLGLRFLPMAAERLGGRVQSWGA